MVVDDDEAVAHLIQMVMEFSGYEAVCFDRPDACLAACREGVVRADLLITDQTMPYMTGLELVEAVRARGAMMPVIVSSGFGQVATPEQTARLAPIFFLSKPFDAVALIKVAREALGPVGG